MSVAQIAVLVLALIGGPVLSIRVVTRGRQDDLARPSRVLHWGFWGATPSFGLAMLADNLLAASPAASMRPFVLNALMIVFYVFGCFYWTAVGVLAHRLRSSWVLWVVIGLVTLAIGFVATYIVMAARVRSEVPARQAAHQASLRGP